MKREVISGIVFGGCIAAVVVWFTVASAIGEGALVAIAAVFDGSLAGVALGALIGVNIAALGAVETDVKAPAARPELARGRS